MNDTRDTPLPGYLPNAEYIIHFETQQHKKFHPQVYLSPVFVINFLDNSRISNDPLVMKIYNEHVTHLYEEFFHDICKIMVISDLL